MNTVASANSDPRIQKVRVTKDQIIADLADGRVISVPLAWSWRLSEATPVQRAKFRLIGTDRGFIGLMWMRTSASKACFTEPRRPVQTRDRRLLRCVPSGRLPRFHHRLANDVSR